MTVKLQPAPQYEYDYEHQAWLVDGKYTRCGHPDTMHCQCYGKLHEGETKEATRG